MIHADVPTRRNSLSVAIRRSERTITKVLATTTTGSLMMLVAAFGLSDHLAMPHVGNAIVWLAVAGLVGVIVFGVPFLVAKGVRTASFAAAAARSRPELQLWASAQGFRFLPKVDGIFGDDTLPVNGLLAALIAHDAELGLELWRDSSPHGKRFDDVVLGRLEGAGDVVVATASGLPAPVLRSRFVALRSGHRLPALSVTDRHNDELWVRPGQQFESVHFNERWRVIAKDPRYASQMVHASLMELFVQSSPDIHRVDFADGWVISWADADVSAAELNGHLQLLSTAAAQVPRFVLRDNA
ncbi:hypothetical protein RPIT_06270 [Tessaracoccus flavus]|uniref:Uncharacterized protein n=1 Tax=Tessaracoccus flavus TaxID=1610493 RepID=A0A1Q2CED3_9ACTN|nr:hypothetical protein RPIT_06270 [Tessaracoccus flavus]SDY70226.1 hypothetical protein SAMN05428934_103199 [Tessaracoccus flavus]